MEIVVLPSGELINLWHLVSISAGLSETSAYLFCPVLYMSCGRKIYVNEIRQPKENAALCVREMITYIANKKDTI